MRTAPALIHFKETIVFFSFPERLPQQLKLLSVVSFVFHDGQKKRLYIKYLFRYYVAV